MLLFKNQKSDFWNQYPEDEKSFENEVRKGIWLRADNKTIFPEAPDGYNWLIDKSGLNNSSKTNYRLWSNKLGYMPGQEQ